MSNVAAEIGGEVLDYIAAEGPNFKLGIVTFVQTELAKGDQAVDALIAQGFKANIPIVGSSLGAAITKIVDSADDTLKADIPALYDHIVAQLAAEAKVLEAE